MRSGDEIFNDFQQSFEGLQGKFHVLDTDIPVEQQMEYFHYSDEIKKNMKGDDAVDNQIEVLNSQESTLDNRKYAMAYLAVSGEVKAYRALETYSNGPVGKLENWAKLSLMQAKIVLESEFSDEKQIFISSGLGGRKDKLRFFAFFKSNHLLPFSSYQIQLIEKEIPFSIGEYHGEMEELIVSENYFTVLFLINLKKNIKNMLEEAVTECNQYGGFIDKSFIITNVKKYNQEEIYQELNKHK